jgi:hypothetical protein
LGSANNLVSWADEAWPHSSAQDLTLAVRHASLIQERHGSLDSSAQLDAVGEATHIGGRVEHDTAWCQWEGNLRISVRMTAQTMPLDHLMGRCVRGPIRLTSWHAKQRPDEHEPGSARRP